MMKRITSLFLSACVCYGASAQSEAVQRALANYEFDQAEKLLQTEINTARRKKQSTDALERALYSAQKAKQKLHATERVTIVDSIVTTRDNVLQQIMLGPEAGTLQSYTQGMLRPDSMDCVIHTNQLGCQRYYSEADEDGYIHLFREDNLEGQWCDKQTLNGLQEEADALNYPFILPDGVTLYYAARCDESMGGYDIFMTRYDTEDNVFLSPENVGMPFNSPYNDYLMVIDEYNQLGWFVSDRGQSGEDVCIYVFIPNQSRHVYGEEVSSAELCNLARINSIKDTWWNEAEVKEAKARLYALRERVIDNDEPTDFEFVMNDRAIFTSLTHFRNEQARKKATFWIESMRQREKDLAELDTLRKQYTYADGTQRQTISAHILTIEKRVEQTIADIKQLETEIRKLESGK